MITLFISYRRSDAEASAGRLYESLKNRLPDAEIFMDVNSLSAGVDFVASLDKALSSAQMMLVVIGRQWLNAVDESGRRRLENEDDFVRREVGRALSRSLPVVPVLVQGAAVPLEDQLPEELKPLARRQAIELRHSAWDDDVSRLLRSIDEPPGDSKRKKKRGGLADILRGAAILCLLTLLAAASWFTWNYVAGAPQREVEGLADQIRYEYPEEKVKASLQLLRDAVVSRNNPSLTSLAVARLKAIVLLDGDTSGKGRHIRAGAMELIKDLRNHNLTIDFKRDDLKETDLVAVDLSRVNLKGLNLANAFLLSTNFDGADLSGVDLSEAGIRNTDFSGVTLAGADLTEADWFDAAGFTPSQLMTVDPAKLMRCPGQKGSHSIAAFKAEFSREYSFPLDSIGDDKDQLMDHWTKYSKPGGLCDVVDKWRRAK